MIDELKTETRWFRFEGKLVEGELDSPIPVIDDEYMAIHWHILKALNQYEDEETGFRFVDVSSGGTLTTGELEFDWSNYGLPIQAG